MACAQRVLILWIVPTTDRSDTKMVKEFDDVSDGYHTFGELYDHRRALTAGLCKAYSTGSWRSLNHHPEDDLIFKGYFIIGVALPTGMITYHYGLAHWDDFQHVITLEHAPRWDGELPQQTVERLFKWAHS